MNPIVKKHLDDAKTAMEKALSHTDSELNKIRAGKASPAMVDSLHVDYYGSMTALSSVANVNTPDARTIVIQPWEKHMIVPIEKAIVEANLGLNPQNDGMLIRINVPPITEERRKDLLKKVKAEIEHGKVTVRNVRKDANDRIKKSTKEGVSEDEVKVGEAEVQKLTDAFVVKLDKVLEVKERDILTV